MGINRLLLIVLTLCPMALAKGASQAELERCASLATVPLKLACFEALVAAPDEENPVAPQDEAAGVFTPAEDFGAEQIVESSSQDKPLLKARVTRVTEGNHGVLLFHMDNNQVWRQIERGFVQYPKNRPFPVEISRGFMGDYRLRVEGKGRMVRIRRIQ